MIRKEIGLASVRKVLETLPGHQDQAFYEMLDYYMQKIIIRHFKYGNTEKYNFPRLNPAYAARKLKKWGPRPTLVASGTLKKDVTTKYKIFRNRRGNWSIQMNIPEYGNFVIDKGFDWRNPDKRDQKDMQRVYKRSLKHIREKFARSLH